MSFRQIVPVTFLALFALVEAGAQTPADELARVLRDKQIITASEFDRIVHLDSSDGVRQLAAILREKGLINATDVAGLNLGLAPSPVSLAAAEPTRTGPSTAADQAPKPTAKASDPDPKLSFHGTLLFNSFFNDQAVNNIDFPAFASAKSAGPQENFGATARQTRLGLSYNGSTVAGANLSGTVEVDFFGGDPALANGVNMDLVRMRLAYGRLDWKHFAIEAGQDWNIFAPLNPTSLAEFAIPEFSASGNLWIRTPQVRTEWKSGLGGKRTFLWQLAALDPNIGDDPADYTTARVPHAGELGRLPAVETRLAFSNPIGDRTATLGMSAHWGTAKNLGVLNGVNTVRNVESWGAAVDYSLPVTSYLAITGEAYAGRALGVFSGGISQSIMPVGEAGDRGVGTRGGWLQLQWNLNRKWQNNMAYGIDLPVLGNLPSGSRAKNQSYMSNIIYKLSPNVQFELEWHRMLTNYRLQNTLNNIGDQFNLAAAYIF